VSKQKTAKVKHGAWSVRRITKKLMEEMSGPKEIWYGYKRILKMRHLDKITVKLSTGLKMEIQLERNRLVIRAVDGVLAIEPHTPNIAFVRARSTAEK
jgi:hypothetical protein